MTDTELLDTAKKTMEHAYAPYSDFKVGAALLCTDGTVYTGCNIENASYGVCNCAERTAVFKAVSEGRRDFSAIAIVSSAGGETFPCGVCRQVLAEFSPNIRVVLQKKDNSAVSYKFEELMPHIFSL